MPEATPQRVLILKPSALGDVVTAMPVLRAARRCWPTAHLSWLLGDASMGLLEGDSDLDTIVPFHRKRLGKCWRHPGAARDLLRFYKALRHGQYDLVLDLQGLLRSGIFAWWTKAKRRVGFADAREGAGWFYTQRVKTTEPHTVMRNIELARAVGLDASPEDMTLQVQSEAAEHVNTLCDEKNLYDDFVVCVPSTRWTTKTYPVRHWRRVVQAIAENRPVALVGSPAPQEQQACEDVAAEQHGHVVNLAGKTTLPQLVALLAKASLVICGDSAAKFIASAVNTPCLCLIGPTRNENTGPFPTGHAMIADIPCQGCLKKRCNHITCMQSILPQQVVDEALALLEAHECP